MLLLSDRYLQCKLVWLRKMTHAICGVKLECYLLSRVKWREVCTTSLTQRRQKHKLVVREETKVRDVIQGIHRNRWQGPVRSQEWPTIDGRNESRVGDHSIERDPEAAKTKGREEYWRVTARNRIEAEQSGSVVLRNLLNHEKQWGETMSRYSALTLLEIVDGAGQLARPTDYSGRQSESRQLLIQTVLNQTQMGVVGGK